LAMGAYPSRSVVDKLLFGPLAFVHDA
jgi:hypothetical protein